MSFSPATRRFGPRTLALAAVLFAAPAWADASRVVLLRAGVDETMKQAETLLAAELRAAGFEVTALDRTEGADLRSEIQVVTNRLGPIATLAIVPAGAGGSAEVWLSDRVTGKFVIRSLDGGGESLTAADVALRAVELLRGSLLEIAIETTEASQPRPRPPADVARFIEKSVPGPTPKRHFLHGLAVEVGGGMLQSPWGLGTSWGASGRLSFAAANGLGLRLGFLAPGPDKTLERIEGQAEVTQALLLLDGVFVFRPRARLQPFATAGGGVHRVHVVGTGVTPLFPAHTVDRYAGALAAGGGLAVRLGNRAALVLDTRALMLAAEARIRIARQEVGRAGGASLLASLGVAGAF